MVQIRTPFRILGNIGISNGTSFEVREEFVGWL